MPVFMFRSGHGISLLNKDVDAIGNLRIFIKTIASEGCVLIATNSEGRVMEVEVIPPEQQPDPNKR